MDWNFGDLLDATGANVPGDRPAIVRGDHAVRWADFDARTNRVARAMRAAGLQPGDRVAILARNIPEFIETAAAAFKARVTHVNINYRYTTAEIEYVLRDCQAAGLFYQDEFQPVVAPLIDGAIDHLILAVKIGGDGVYETMAADGDPAPLGIERSPDDGYLLYTGGTTGRPKGVMWRSADARRSQLESPVAVAPPASMDDHVALVRRSGAGRVLPACPLMHGAGLNSCLAELLVGGTAVLLPFDRFDAEMLWDEVARQAVTRILIVGDAFARPMADALARHPGRWDLSALRLISSAGLMWSEEVKAQLIGAAPQLTLLDILGASEASGFGYAIATRDRATPTGTFEPGPHTVIVTAEDRILTRGEPGAGWLARRPPFGAGYHGDPAKTATVYRTIGGDPYAVPGDMAEWLPDGRFRLLGRGSMCINTGGEKVFVEEVEEALKRVPGIADALVFGMPDPKWGSVVAALIEAGPSPDDAAINAALAADLASYKLPRRIARTDAIPRHASGKSDYRRAADIARAAWA